MHEPTDRAANEIADRRRVIAVLAALVGAGAVGGAASTAEAGSLAEVAVKVLADALETKDMGASLSKHKARKILPAPVVSSFESLTREDLAVLAKFKMQVGGWADHKDIVNAVASFI